MKLIIAGSRDFTNYNYLDEIVMSGYAQELDEIVCGEARGADLLGRRWAEEHEYPIASFPADWDKYGKTAGYIRNTQMADYGDYLLAFWDGKSKGTRHMINIALDHAMPVRVVIV
jgi:hypothetical protein